MEESSFEEEEEEFDKEGLGTQLRPKSKGAFRGSEELENLLSQLEREILSVGWDNEMPRRCKKNWDMNETIRILEESDQVIVPTDKTNSFRCMDTKTYLTMVNGHLRCSSKENERDKVRKIFEKARELLDEVGFQLSKSEVGHINKSLKTKSIPTPKLLIKDHKKSNTNGEFPTRLVIPATNFIAIFAKVVYLGLKAILDNHQVDYKKYTITQASQVKEYWEKLERKREKVTIVSIDTVYMYPLIKSPLWKKRFNFTQRNYLNML